MKIQNVYQNISNDRVILVQYYNFVYEWKRQIKGLRVNSLNIPVTATLRLCLAVCVRVWFRVCVHVRMCAGGHVDGFTCVSVCVCVFGIGDHSHTWLLILYVDMPTAVAIVAPIPSYMWRSRTIKPLECSSSEAPFPFRPHPHPFLPLSTWGRCPGGVEGT